MSKKITPTPEGQAWIPDENYSPSVMKCASCKNYDYLIFAEAEKRLVCSKCFNHLEGND